MRLLPLVIALCLAAPAAFADEPHGGIVVAQMPADPNAAAEPDEGDKPSSQGAEHTGDPVLAANGLPEVYYGDALLPEPVRRMRQRLMEAAATGDIEAVRPIMEGSDPPPVVSVGEGRGDALDFLKAQSGDPDGREILAILDEVLSAGYVHLDPGKPTESYVWPYFAYYPVAKLSPPQMVELFKIITSQDLADMKEYGAYVFFRLGIGRDGKWQFFLSGD